ncbi:MAG: aminoglycoside phosphotransferase family protein [Actinomycetota bacterium]
MSLAAVEETPSTQTLIEILQPGVDRHFGRPSPIENVQRIASKFSTSSPIEDLSLKTRRGRLKLIFKDLSPGRLLDEARKVRPGFVYDPRREIEVYRRVLASNPMGTARFFGATTDDEAGSYRLFVERVPGVELYQVEDPSVWEQVGAWLGRLHDRLEGNTEVNGLPQYDAAWYRRWMDRAARFTSRASPQRREAIDNLAPAHESAVEKICELPSTVIHGDFNASNIVLSPRSRAIRICPVDWERAAVGPGMVDLAALTIGWDERRSAQMARAYAESNRNAREMNSQQLFHYLDCCRLHLCVQWLGWSPVWVPPEEHRRDWLAEATAIAEKLRKRPS